MMASSSSSSPSSSRNEAYLAPVFRYADRCHRLQREVGELAALAGTRTMDMALHSLEEELVQQQLLLIRVCCDASLSILLRGKATWSNPSHAVRAADVEEARRLMQLAEVTLKSSGVVALERRSVFEARRMLEGAGDGDGWEGAVHSSTPHADTAAVGMGTSSSPPSGEGCTTACSPAGHGEGEEEEEGEGGEGAGARYTTASIVAKGSRLLMGAWPRILVATTACTVYYLAGQTRAAAAHGDKAWALIQRSVFEDPSCLIMACLAAGGGHHCIAEQVIAAMASYGAVLSAMCRLDEALRFGQMSAALSQQLHAELLMRAAFMAAGAEEGSGAGGGGSHASIAVGDVAATSIHYGTPEASAFLGVPPSPPPLFDATMHSFIQSPSMLANRTPTALLTAITLHNCVCIMRRVREQANLPCIADNPNRRRMLSIDCSNERQEEMLTTALDLAVAELGVLEVKAASNFVPMPTACSSSPTKPSSPSHPTTFIELLQLKLAELRQGCGPVDAPSSASPRGGRVGVHLPACTVVTTATHAGRVEGLDALIRESSVANGAACTTTGPAGPHSTFTPAPRPRVNYNPTHGADGLKAPYKVGLSASTSRSTRHSSAARSPSAVRRRDSSSFGGRSPSPRARWNLK